MNDEVDQGRRRFLTVATMATGAVGAGFAAVPFVASWKPSARARALGAPVTVDVSALEPGAMMTISWRRQPIWIVRRTREMLASLARAEAQLKDPGSDSSEQPEFAHNEHRSRKPEYLVLVGICTHLGCLPKTRFEPGAGEGVGADWPGGFFCVCHGSKFDLAGRVFAGSPASANLRVPPYYFPDDNTVLVGESAPAATGVA
jgi:ubiquinol-cytochrome c reductase iron-sulfur subunit